MSENIRVLMVSKNIDDSQTVEFKVINENQLMKGNVIVKVTHSTLNYKELANGSWRRFIWYCRKIRRCKF